MKCLPRDPGGLIVGIVNLPTVLRACVTVEVRTAQEKKIAAFQCSCNDKCRIIIKKKL